MMQRNMLLLWSLVLAGLYWIAGIFAGGPYMTGAVSIGLLVFSGLTLTRYGPEAWAVLIHQRRNASAPEGDGSHLAAYGVALLAAGSVYVGTFGLAWIWAGQPPAWLSTPVSGFGRFMQASGFALLFLSPDFSRRGLRLPTGWWVAAVCAALLAVGIVIGIHIGREDDDAAPILPVAAMINECPDETPIAGNQGSRGWIYHVPGGPFYDRTVPEACYATEEEARLAGYRPAGR